MMQFSLLYEKIELCCVSSRHMTDESSLSSLVPLKDSSGTFFLAKKKKKKHRCTDFSKAALGQLYVVLKVLHKSNLIDFWSNGPVDRSLLSCAHYRMGR